MSLVSSISLTQRLIYPVRAFSTSWANKLSGYYELLQSSDREKVRKIAETFLSEGNRVYFNSSNLQVSPKELSELIAVINSTMKFPIEYLMTPTQQEEAMHFRANKTFINLPYSEKVSKWADRNALQSLIRTKFNNLFEPGDLVLVPGCADAQIPIEIQANGVKHEIDVDVVAADFNDIAMKLGYCTMKSYGLDPNRIQWVQADITSSSFFDWMAPKLSSKSRHQIVTLIQPSLRETSLISFLKRSYDLAHQSRNPTTIVMPVLLEDHETTWYQNYEIEVERAFIVASKTHDIPQLTWNKTQFGREVLKLNAEKSAYVPQQYFVLPEAIPEIQKITGYSEAAHKIFGAFPQSGTYGLPGDPRIIESKYSKRVFCVWEVK